MSTATQQTEVRTVYVTCRLGKSELNRLFSLAPEGIPAAAVQISTQRDSTRYRAGNLTDLVDHVRNSNASGNLDDWDNIRLDAADATGDRKVAIHIDTGRVEVQASGIDATWVHGQAARIELLLKGAGGEIRNAPQEMKTRRDFALAGLTAIPSAYLTVYAAGQAVPEADRHPGSWPQLAAQLVGIAIVVGTFWLARKIVRRVNRALLMPTAEVPHGSWWSRASNTDKIGLGSLAVAFLALIVAVLTLGKDLVK
ncbi:hypothetical protein [Streptomyces vietnamensis]|uniref:hypothetical protein n=1 Tax=Streptomyces vietnamensis TaxID=362257 RepID=UPI00341B86A3